jgi:hypothetical protein
MRSLKFRALVTLDPDTERTSSAVRRLVVRAHRHGPEGVRAFNAVVITDDQEPLRAGDTHHVVTMTITEEEALDLLRPGDRFELWSDHQLGHGVVSRRVFV